MTALRAAVHGWTAAAARLAAAALLAAAAMPGGAFAADYPGDLLGTWTVGAVVGASPGQWEVQSGQELVGRTITVTPDRMVVFGRFSGGPVLKGTTTGQLSDILKVPPQLREPTFPEADAVLRFQQVALSDCKLDGKQQDACPLFIFAFDDTAHTVSLVTLPWGLAHLDRRDTAAR